MKELTPIQIVVRYWKVLKDFEPEDKAWDKFNFPRYVRPANELLSAFNGDAGVACRYLGDKYIEMASKGFDCGFHWIARKSWDDAKDFERRLNGNGPVTPSSRQLRNGSDTKKVGELDMVGGFTGARVLGPSHPPLSGAKDGEGKSGGKE